MQTTKPYRLHDHDELNSSDIRLITAAMMSLWRTYRPTALDRRLSYLIIDDDGGRPRRRTYWSGWKPADLRVVVVESQLELYFSSIFPGLLGAYTAMWCA